MSSAPSPDPSPASPTSPATPAPPVSPASSAEAPAPRGPAPSTVPTLVEVTVDGGTLATFRYGPAGAGPERTVLAVHGITASSRAWGAVARALPEGWCLVAVDLRGRGGSRDLPASTRLDDHVGDLERVVAHLDPAGTGDLVLAGHSLGAYVALLLAADSPHRFRRLVLVDGGLPLPVPDDVDLDDLLQATLGPALTRLSQTFADAEAYVELFRQHPALGPHWNPDVETYVRYDALETLDGVRSRAVEDAVRADGRDLLGLGQRLDGALRGLSVPTTLLAAPLGMFGETPGLLPAAAVSSYAEMVPCLEAETVADVNHYTILFDPAAVTRVTAALTL